MSSGDNNEGVLSRWSKRKLENQAGQAQEPAEGPAKNPAGGLTDGQDQISKSNALPSAEHEQLAEEARIKKLEANREAAEAVDLSELDAKSDLSLFMKEGVPAELKKRALSLLWRSDPVFSNIDGLVDYGENFADPALNMKTFVSAYKVGRGYLDKLAAEEEEKLAAEAMNEASNALANGEEAVPPEDENQPDQETASLDEPKPDDTAIVDNEASPQSPEQINRPEAPEEETNSDDELPERISLRNRLSPIDYET